VGSDTDYNIDIRLQLVFRLVLQLGQLNGPQGYLTDGLYYLYPCQLHTSTTSPPAPPLEARDATIAACLVAEAKEVELAVH
jgi:hypothetical protein